MIDSQELINAIFAYNWVNYIFSWKTLVCMVILALLGAAILGEEFLDDIEKIEAEETSRVKFILSTGLFVSFYILSVITTQTHIHAGNVKMRKPYRITRQKHWWTSITGFIIKKK